MDGLRNALIAAFAALLTSSAGPTATVNPSLTGALRQGEKLTAVPGTWSGAGPVTYAFQWYRCDANGAHCSSIHGATKGSYTEVAKDVGATIGLTVRATDPTGTTPAYAPLAGLVAPAGGALVPAAQPALSGGAAVGLPVQVAAVHWSTTPASTSYAWERCNVNGRLCAPIAGATEDTYVATAGDSGLRLVAAITATAGTATQTVLSLPTAPVGATAGPMPQGRPSLAGVPQQGRKLSGRAGTWLGSAAITYAFQWYRCDTNGAHCSSIHGATKASYTEVAKDVGATIGLTVRATDATGTAPAYSALTGIVAATGSTLVPLTQPSLTGRAAVGQTLAVKPGAWSATPASTGYGWLRCNANGRACVAIPGASGGTYAPVADDAGHTIVATVLATAGAAHATVLTVASGVVH